MVHNHQVGNRAFFPGQCGLDGCLVAPAVIKAVLGLDLEIQIIGPAWVVEVNGIVEFSLIQYIAERIHRVVGLGIFGAEADLRRKLGFSTSPCSPGRHNPLQRDQAVRTVLQSEKDSLPGGPYCRRLLAGNSLFSFPR